MKTYSAKPAEVEKKWVVIDANGLVVGRLASIVALRLRGKHKPSFTPHVDCGDFVVIVNAEHVKLTGPKDKTKVYYRHSGYPGGIREQTAEKMRATHPERLLRLAVTGMLPKNRLGRRLVTKLKIYVGPEHPHAAQQPLAITGLAAGRN